ncbi:hypothetical protein HELRODRAFT_178678 [Helobdella robusta]|uniref:Uncharacterized protein n=1 Tax=Helobdella robusta TaxID=6412 RepID=T1FDK1_HELRO|nr:hypothetical protein HELRODRAFT_178678 [Helobdella robusta]ESN96878.1 hypothetical protein HELRODRAFT_178678 [Helobdella robusta]
MLKNKKYLFKRYIKNSSQENYKKFSNVSEQCKKMVSFQKKQYGHELINNSKSGCKKTWSIIRNILNKNNCDKDRNSKLMSNGQHLNSPEKLNKYFTELAQNVQSSLPKSSIRKDMIIKSVNVPNSFFLLETSSSEIIEVTKLLKCKSSYGYDHISMKIVISTIGVQEAGTTFYKWVFLWISLM